MNPYIPPVQDKIPIIAYGPIPAALNNVLGTHNKREKQVETIFKKLNECGFNAVHHSGSHDNVFQFFKMSI